MATIIEFHARDRGTDSAADHQGERATAEILLFTGIRYERHRDAAPAAGSTEPVRKPRGARKRDRLEIAD